jgi:hypothetical protein
VPFLSDFMAQHARHDRARARAKGRQKPYGQYEPLSSCIRSEVMAEWVRDVRDTKRAGDGTPGNGWGAGSTASSGGSRQSLPRMERRAAGVPGGGRLSMTL